MLAAHEATLHRPEDRLLARCRAGDLEAFRQIYEEHERHVFRYAYHVLGHADDADDVKQETFLRAYRALASFRSDCSLRTWLLRICANLCRDRIKSRERRPEVLYDPVTTPEWLGDHSRSVDPQAVAERTEMASILRKALGGMPADQREIIVLRDVEQMSYEEIAEVLGCSRPSVKLRLFRARRRLKERVESLLTARS